MKNFASLVLALSLVCVPALRAQGTPPADKDQALAQLLQVERDVIRANNECDYAYFRLIEADEFIFTGSNGNVVTRAEDLAGEKDCRRSNSEQVIDEPRLLFYGNHAVLSARNTTSVKKADGATTTSRSRFTDVFVWRDGRWQMIAGHSSRIPPT